MKSQVSVIYDGNAPKKIDTVVVSAQHSPSLSHDAIKAVVMEHIISPVLAEYEQYVDGPINYHINPTGIFVIGGQIGRAHV